MRKLINNIKDDLRLLKFLLLHDKKYRHISLTIIGGTATVLFGLLQFDFGNLLQAKKITNDTIQILLWMGSTVLLLSGLIALLVLNRYYFRRWRKPFALPSEDLEKLNRYYGK
jgi:hypothetical protein